MRSKDRFRGCLCGGAVGDALGYPVEFLEDGEIFRRFGEGGITDYVLTPEGVAEVSDDTQMTLFTAGALLTASTVRRVTGEKTKPYRQYLIDAYRDWYRTQEKNDGEPGAGGSWLCSIPELNNSRSPGTTCISVLSGDRFGSVRSPLNDRKGCGGLMRVAPIGLFFGSGEGQLPKIDLLAAEAAAITHGHELGYLPAAVLAHIVHLGVYGEAELDEAIEDAMETVGDLFPNAVHWKEFQDLIDRAAELADEEMDDLDAIRELGQGFTADETLAIAVYCALKYENDFERGIIAAVNHSGDSDSTASVTGNILGAFLGVRAIPTKFLRPLEMLDIIAEVADDLYDGCHPDSATGRISDEWAEKYLVE